VRNTYYGQNCGENQKTGFMFNNSFFLNKENCAVFYIMRKNIVEQDQVTDGNMAHEHWCWIPKAKDTT